MQIIVFLLKISKKANNFYLFKDSNLTIMKQYTKIRKIQNKTLEIINQRQYWSRKNSA